MSMRANKAKNPRSIRYLLYADRRLQRLSLKRLSERLKKKKQPPRSSRLKNSAGPRNATPFPPAISSRAIVLGAICVVAAAAVITARQPSRRSELAPADAPAVIAPTPNLPADVRLEPKKTAVAKAPAAGAGAKPDPADASIRKTPAAEPVKALAVESTVKAPAAESAPKAAVVESTAGADLQNAPLLTIMGCVERDDETFWLKDTTGVDAPKSRSWKSGFLRKRSSRIELVDATNTLRLPDYVGQRVAATGMLMNRGMQARSLQPVAASCN
jgi:hypothetical protein